MEELNKITKETQLKMEKTLSKLEKDFSFIRVGRASPLMLESVYLEYYGARTPLKQLANITVPDAMTLLIFPHDKSIFSQIEKAIIRADLGFTPSSNGDNIRINLPILTQERREEIIKKDVKKAEEAAKISIRSIRKEANQFIKKIKGIGEDLIKDAEDKIQKLTDDAIKSVENHSSLKQKEILKI